MIGTLPGRTQGLGLITEPLLRDLQIDRVHFARMNLWATLKGSAQALTVIASALGPLVLVETLSRTGSYALTFYLLTVAVLVLALLA